MLNIFDRFVEREFSFVFCETYATYGTRTARDVQRHVFHAFTKESSLQLRMIVYIVVFFLGYLFATVADFGTLYTQFWDLFVITNPVSLRNRVVTQRETDDGILLEILPVEYCRPISSVYLHLL